MQQHPLDKTGSIPVPPTKMSQKTEDYIYWEFKICLKEDLEIASEIEKFLRLESK
jgi:hypothetical protein